MTENSALPADLPLGDLEVVHSFTSGPMPTGVTVSRTGRIFVNYPKWGDDVEFTVAEIVDGEALPYPSVEANSPRGDDDASALVSVQSVVVDPADRLWMLDTGSPLFRETTPGGPKLVRVDLETNRVAQTITFSPTVALPTTYLNDVRFDLRRDVAFITDSADSGPNGIIVVDLATGEAWRRLHDHPSTVAVTPPDFVAMVEGRQFLERTPEGDTSPVTMGADGIAISADGDRLWYCPLASRRWYSVSTAALLDRSLDDAAVASAVVDEGDKGGGADGLETDDTGRIYATNWEHNAIMRRLADGELETVAHDPRILWPDTMSIASDGYLYFTANQLHRQERYQSGTDRREYPYSLFRIAIGAGPVLLA
jgi:sugar lactone lactonase YvrE